MDIKMIFFEAPDVKDRLMVSVSESICQAAPLQCLIFALDPGPP